MLKENKGSEFNNFNNNNNLEITYNIDSVTEQEYNDTIEFKTIKKLLCEENLQYVTEYLRTLLKIEKTNNPNCFKCHIFNDYMFMDKCKNKVILYLRLSVEDLEKTEGNVSKSILNQLLMLLSYCRDKQLEVVGIFYEEDISGGDDTRPEWNKTLLFCELGNTNIYICKSQSRFARSIEYVGKYLHKKFVEWNIRFLSIVDNIDTSNKGNKKSSQITAMTDEWKLEDQSNNTKKTLNSKNNAGQWTGSFAPFGYIEDPEDMYHIIIDEPAAKVVRNIYEMYANGMGYSKICRDLNEKKIPTPSKYKKLQGLKYVCPTAPNGSEHWNTDTIRKILMDETYDGVLIQHRTENISYNIKGRKKIPKIEQSIVACAHDKIVEPNISQIVRKKFKERKDKQLLQDAKNEANKLVKIIEESDSERKKIDKEKQAKINYALNDLKESLLTKDLNDIVEKYNSLRELIATLNPDFYLQTQDEVEVLSTTKTRAKPDKDGQVHIFSQKVYCKCCGKIFQKNQFKSGPRHSDIKTYKSYLCCKTRKRTSGDACDNNNSIRYELLEEIILREINKKIEEYYDRTKLEKSYYEKKVYSNYQKDIEALTKEKIDIDRKVKSNKEKFTLLYEDRATGVITPEEFVMLKNKYQSDNDKYGFRINEINSEINELENKKEQESNESILFEKYKNLQKLDRLVIDTFISKIIIGKVDPMTKKRDMKIVWNIVT